MPGDPRDHKRTFQNAANSEKDPADRVFEEWIKLREDQGWTREAAYTELMMARGALLSAIEDRLVIGAARAPVVSRQFPSSTSARLRSHSRSELKGSSGWNWPALLEFSQLRGTIALARPLD